MILHKNDIVVLRPLKQIPNWQSINTEIYNKYKGKLLQVTEIEQYISYTKIVYREFLSNKTIVGEFSGTCDIAIIINDTEGV